MKQEAKLFATMLAVTAYVVAALLLWFDKGTAGHAQAAPVAPQDIGEFVAFCPFSHRASNDPVVHPGMPGMSHSHDFFGNVTTDATSTLASLSAGDTTCDPATDRSAYWVPTLYDADGDIIPVEQATFYYLVDIDDPQQLQPYPLGLTIIAGQAKATSAPNPSHFKWSCQGDPTSSTTDFVVCPADSKLELLLNFPDCWDGVNLDSADHQSHMAYSAGGACPASHPVPVPRLQFKLRYATPGEPGMVLDSGPAYTTHGDFINVWDEAALANRMNCLHNLIKCGPEGYPFDDPTTTPTATPTHTSTATPTPTATPTHTSTATPPATDTPEPDPGEYGISINDGALFTNQISVTLALSARTDTTEMQISNDGGFAGAIWEPYTPQKAWTITQLGNYVIPRVVYVRYRNSMGDISASFSDDIVLDLNAPTGSVEIEPARAPSVASPVTPGAKAAAQPKHFLFLPATQNNGCPAARPANVTLRLHATDDVSGVGTVMIDNRADFACAQWESYSESKAWHLSAGNPTVYVKFQDNAGNVSAVVTATRE